MGRKYNRRFSVIVVKNHMLCMVIHKLEKIFLFVPWCYSSQEDTRNQVSQFTRNNLNYFAIFIVLLLATSKSCNWYEWSTLQIFLTTINFKISSVEKFHMFLNMNIQVIFYINKIRRTSLVKCTLHGRAM